MHRIVIAECRRFPKLGRLFYETGPEACIDPLEAFFVRHRNDRSLKVSDPHRAADDGRVGGEARRPQRVADHGDRRRAGGELLERRGRGK